MIGVVPNPVKSARPMKSHPTLILASTSRYRRELLQRLKLDFFCKAPGVAETPQPGESPAELARRLARTKAQAVAAQSGEAWVIGSDQVAVLEAESGAATVGKPGTAERCRAQLLAASGQTLTFLTAVCVTRHGGAICEFTDTTHVQFRELDESTIARYVAAESPLDCAGGFKSEGLGISLCQSIHSEDPSALIGLPLIRLSAVLREVGFLLP